MPLRRTIPRCLAVCIVLLLVSTSAVRRTHDADEDESAVQGVPPVMPDVSHESQNSEPGSAPENTMDSEEFTGANAGSQEEQQPETPIAPEPKPRIHQAKPQRDYSTEMLIGAITLAYMVNYAIGRRTNQTIADSWGKQLLEDTNVCSIGKNFALVSPDKNPKSTDNPKTVDTCMVKDSCSCFQIYSTGRRHCRYMMTSLDLTSRQDLFAVVYNHFFGLTSGVFDAVNVEVALDSDLSAKYCVCICTNPRRMKTEYKDIEHLPEQKVKLPKGLVMLSECDDISSEFVRACGPDVMKALESLRNSIEYIYISEQSSADPRHPYMMRCVFKAPTLKLFQANPELVLNQVRLAVALVDVVAQVSSWCEKHPTVMTKVVTLRTAARGSGGQEKQQERVQKRRDDKLAAEIAKKAKMSDDQLAKYEEKEYKKKMRKQSRGGNGKMKIMKM